MSEPKRVHRTGCRRKLTNEELHNLYSSTNITTMIKSRLMGYVGLAVSWKRREMHTGSWWRNLTVRHHLEELGNNGSIILKWIQNKHGGKV